jgi:phosphatidylserine/phosphatidylglycerophosphate/cardiolipin synthase-like enzyme
LSILAEGRNCWRIEKADKAAVLIDAAPYFEHLQSALLQARRSILIIGWDFDASIKLRPEDDPRTLGELLRECVEANEELEVRVLVWSIGVVHGPGAPFPLLFGAEWHNHPRIHVKLDTEHPVYAAHHQKIVAIDDRIAFAGGIDLTIERWDTGEHRTDHPGRVCPDGTPYGPVHDLQMAVSGDAARAIGDLARHRWRSGTGEALLPPDGCGDTWPADLVPDFTATEVAIARTAPAWGDHRGAREGAALAGDALAAARSLIYIEAQYLTTASVGRVLMRQLAAPEGPEIVVVVTKSSHSKVEHYVMGNNRDRLLRRLKKVDRYGRLHVLYPVNGPQEDCKEILVHSKLLLVDDVFLRIGSSNLNNRSLGLDTECDLAIEARSEAERLTIRSICHRLLAEHVCVSYEEVAQAAREETSLVRLIARFNGTSCRCLKPLDVDPDGSTRPVLGTAILDPAKPFEPSWLLRRRKRLHATFGRSLQSIRLSRASLARNVSSLAANTRPPIASGTRK